MLRRLTSTSASWATVPLRLALGPDAVDVVRNKLASLQENLDAWLDVSSATDFDQ